MNRKSRDEMVRIRNSQRLIFMRLKIYYIKWEKATQLKVEKTIVKSFFALEKAYNPDNDKA